MHGDIEIVWCEAEEGYGFWKERKREGKLSHLNESRGRYRRAGAECEGEEESDDEMTVPEMKETERVMERKRDGRDREKDEFDGDTGKWAEEEAERDRDEERRTQ